MMRVEWVVSVELEPHDYDWFLKTIAMWLVNLDGVDSWSVKCPTLEMKGK